MNPKPSFVAELPLGPGVRVLTEHAAGLFALEKPAGVLSHPNEPGAAKNALLTAPYDETRECYSWTDATGATRRAHLLNRLDSPTSGVVLIATDASLADQVRELFSGREVAKTYHAVVKGARILPSRGEWRDLLKKSRTGDFVRASAGSGGIESLSFFAHERSNKDLPGLSLLRLEPKTGRTHQLRIQAALHGHPILGDKTYGDFGLNKATAARDAKFNRLFLHCSRTEFSYRFAGAEHRFVAESPLPDAFAGVLGGSIADRVTVGDGKRVIRLKPRR